MKKSLRLYLNFFLLILTIVLMHNCQPVVQDQENNDSVIQEENLIKINKLLVAKDSELIEKYIQRRKWDMQRTQTGLIYQIYHHGNGEKSKEGKLATITYRVELPDGTLCYSSDSLGAKTFMIGQGGVESGLEEGILLMREGDKARFIMPPHLAHGLTGDGNKIPGRTIIIYDVELLNVE